MDSNSFTEGNAYNVVMLLIKNVPIFGHSIWAVTWGKIMYIKYQTSNYAFATSMELFLNPYDCFVSDSIPYNFMGGAFPLTLVVSVQYTTVLTPPYFSLIL